MPTNTQTVDAEVIPPDEKQVGVGIPNIRFNLGTTLQSPFFWLVVGLGIGAYIGWGQGKSKQSRNEMPWI